MEDHLQLIGDGIHDDTTAIQRLLDSGTKKVYLPPPQIAYAISRPLIIHSQQELRLDRYSTVRLLPNSNCTMLENANPQGGDHNIAVTGGIWDFDNLNQYPNPWLLHMSKKQHGPKPVGYTGTCMEFRNINGLHFSGMIIRNPVTYAAAFHKITNFVIDDIEFDFTSCNPSWANMDGVHLNGLCSYGRITNLRGTCYDDLLAINAPEGDWPGPITDIEVDGILCEYCHSAVRLLSYGEPVERITLRGIHGNFYRYMIGITHFLNDKPGPGIFNDIVIRDCYCGKARQPEELWKLFPMAPILIESFCEIGNLYIGNVHRDEHVENVPFIAYNVDSDRPVAVDSHIRSLTIENCSMTNHLSDSLEFFHCDGEIDHLEFRNNHCHSVQGAGPCIPLAGKRVGKWEEQI